MSLIQILNYSQKKEFETPPLLEYEIRQEIFSVSPIIKQQIESIEIDSNKVRFIAMYGYFKVPLCFLRICDLDQNLCGIFYKCNSISTWI